MSRFNGLAGIGALLGLMSLAQAEQPANKKAELPPLSPITQLIGPFTKDNLSIFLIQGPNTIANRPFLTLHEAMEQKKVVVHETSNVNELTIESLAEDIDIFVQTGDIVKGGKQDRVISFSMVLSPKSGKVPLASFCVEAGRWAQRGKEEAGKFENSPFQAGGNDLKLAINRDRVQDGVWDKVRVTQQKLAKALNKNVQNSNSPTSLQLTLEDKELLKRLENYESALAKVTGGQANIIGVAVAVNGKLDSADVYAHSEIFAKLWPKLLRAAAISALCEFSDKIQFNPLSADGVRAALAEVDQAAATEVSMVVNRGRAVPNNDNNRFRPQNGPIQTNNPAPQAVNNVPETAPVVNPPAIPCRVYRCEAGKMVLVVSRQKADPSIVLHRCYMVR